MVENIETRTGADDYYIRLENREEKQLKPNESYRLEDAMEVRGIFADSGLNANQESVGKTPKFY